MAIAARNSSYKLSGMVTLLYRYSSSSPSPAGTWNDNNNKFGYGARYMMNIGRGGLVTRSFTAASGRGGINRSEAHDTGNSHFNYTM